MLFLPIYSTLHIIFMGDLSFGEIFIIFLLIIILFGPKKIPEIARGLGQGLRKVRSAADDIKQEIMKETEDNPISEIQKEIEKVKESVNENLKDEK